MSLGHIHKRKLEKTEVSTKESSYLLLSQTGAGTPNHQDISGTSVMDFLVKGKTVCSAFFSMIFRNLFYLVLFPFGLQNVLFVGSCRSITSRYSDYLMRQPLRRKPMSPGDDPRCDAGGCQKVVLTERQVLVMPAGLIHRVETLSKLVALGVNFIHHEHLLTAARVFRHERKDD